MLTPPVAHHHCRPGQLPDIAPCSCPPHSLGHISMILPLASRDSLAMHHLAATPSTVVAAHAQMLGFMATAVGSW